MKNEVSPSETHLIPLSSFSSPLGPKGADANPGGDANSFICNDQQFELCNIEKTKQNLVKSSTQLGEVAVDGPSQPI